MRIVTLLTDFGTADGYVAEMKGVLLTLAPHVQLVDAAHDLEPHDVELARLALARYWRRYPAGSVHLAVVDPGVGTARRALAVGFGTATAAVVGQNLGAGQVERARRAAWVGVGYALVPAGAMALLMLLVPAQLADLFTDDPAVVAETARYLRIAAVAQVALVLEVVLEGALGGAGDTDPPMLASTTLTAARLPLAAAAAAVWGVSGIWWTITLTAAARGVAIALIWRSGRWARRSL